ncbi:MAG: NADH-quinone oxidoreductase subunit C [Nitriliruptoraceae bacterium]
MSEVLARRDRALTPEETEQLLTERLGSHVQGSLQEYGVFTLWIAPEGWVEAARRCAQEPLLAYDMFDSLFGVDRGDDGFDVIAILYSTSTGNRIALRTRCEGGRDAPTCPSITEVYRGADWMERETYDMFGVDFPGHPGLEPRLLTVANFEGWPLRKDFHLASRVAKPWPGVKEPAELDEEGNVVEREQRIGDAPGPYDLDKAMAEQAQRRNAPALDAPDAVDEQAGADEDAEPRIETDDQAAAGASAKADERRRAQAEARARKAAERSGEAEGGDQAEAEDIDRETYDRLIAEGKSERIARSKAKAALIKKQRAQQRADDGDEEDA